MRPGGRASAAIEVLDDGAGVGDQGASDDGGPGSGSTGTGQGLAGMAERARIYAGSVEAGRTGRGWRVRAVLSWPGDNHPDPDHIPQLQGRT